MFILLRSLVVLRTQLLFKITELKVLNVCLEVQIHNPESSLSQSTLFPQHERSKKCKILLMIPFKFSVIMFQYYISVLTSIRKGSSRSRPFPLFSLLLRRDLPWEAPEKYSPSLWPQSHSFRWNPEIPFHTFV